MKLNRFVLRVSDDEIWSLEGWGAAVAILAQSMRQHPHYSFHIKQRKFLERIKGTFNEFILLFQCKLDGLGWRTRAVMSNEGWKGVKERRER